MQETPDGMLLSKPHAMLLTNWAEVAEEVSSLGRNNQGLRQKQVDCLLRVRPSHTLRIFACLTVPAH